MSDPTPAVPRPAATVMVVRPEGATFEVFMVRRPRAARFAADVFVFPGGTVRPDDRLEAAAARAIGLDPDALHAVLAEQRDPWADEPDGGVSIWVAALRELFEEAGVLLAEDECGALVDLDAPDRAGRFELTRGALQRGELSLADLARAERLRLAADRLIYFSRWITPVVSPRRYDTRFFLAELPTGQTAGHCQIETVDGAWVAPRRALERFERDELPMMFVTSEHIRRLAEFDDPEALLAFARHRQTTPVRPVVDDLREPYLTPEQRRNW